MDFERRFLVLTNSLVLWFKLIQGYFWNGKPYQAMRREVPNIAENDSSNETEKKKNENLSCKQRRFMDVIYELQNIYSLK